MNYELKRKLRKRILDTLTLDWRINWFRLNRKASFKHELTKFKLALKLVRQDHNVIVEARFKKGGQADIIDLETGTIYEILCSESKKKAKEKVKKYPEFLETEFIFVK